MQNRHTYNTQTEKIPECSPCLSPISIIHFQNKSKSCIFFSIISIEIVLESQQFMNRFDVIYGIRNAHTVLRRFYVFEKVLSIASTDSNSLLSLTSSPSSSSSSCTNSNSDKRRNFRLISNCLKVVPMILPFARWPSSATKGSSRWISQILHLTQGTQQCIVFKQQGQNKCPN